MKPSPNPAKKLLTPSQLFETHTPSATSPATSPPMISPTGFANQQPHCRANGPQRGHREEQDGESQSTKACAHRRQSRASAERRQHTKAERHGTEAGDAGGSKTSHRNAKPDDTACDHRNGSEQSGQGQRADTSDRAKREHERASGCRNGRKADA
jgi:hypothetical protein